MTKCSLKTCIVLLSLDEESSLYHNHKEKKQEVFSAWKQEIVEFHTVMIVLKVEESQKYKTISRA